MAASFVFCTHAADAVSVPEENAVIMQTDIGIRPEDFRRMISSEEKTPYSVWVASDGQPYRGARMNIRGSSSKMAGMLMPTKRIPFELVFDSAADAFPPFNNPSVKFINCLMPFRLLEEYIGLDLFAAAGVPTPEHKFSFLRLNGVDYGVYLAVEDIDKQFIAKHFSGNIGSLYKSSNLSDASRDLHTVWFGSIFVKTDRGSQTLSSLLAALERGEGFEDYLDMDEVLRFLACTAAIGGSASVLTEQSNFALYDNGGKFVLLPWDVSESFYGFVSGNGIDHFKLDNSETPNPLFELIMKNPENREKYHAYIRQINDTFLSPARIKPYLLSIIRQVAPYLRRDHTIFRNVPDLEKAMTTGNVIFSENLLAVLDEAHRQIQDQLDGKIDSYYLNEERFVMPDLQDPQSWFEAMSQSADGYDASIVDRVCDGYEGWHKDFVKHDLFRVRKDFFLAAAVFVPCFLLVLFRRRILLLIRARRERRAAGGDTAE